MKLLSKIIILIAVAFCATVPAQAQFGKLINKKTISAAAKAAKAVTLTDEQMTEYVKEYIDWMDANNRVCKADDPQTAAYVARLDSLTEGLTSADGLPLNFKVYYVIDVNAFACADGSVRVFSSLMDIMSDDELLGVIGHEIGHVAHHDSKNAFKQALLTSALKDAVGATSDKAAALTESQLGDLSEALVSATYSQKAEQAADDYGYEFLRDHGKNPRAMAKSFLRLKSLQEEQGVGKTSKINQLFSSHPDLDARIERMTKRANNDGCPE